MSANEIDGCGVKTILSNVVLLKPAGSIELTLQRLMALIVSIELHAGKR
jgi:hypothetical protein